MEPNSTVALSLALGAAAAAGNAVVSTVVKDGYETLKELLKGRYPKLSLESLEQAPESKGRRTGVEEELSAAGADKDTELMAAALKVIELIQRHAPSAMATIGVDLKDVSAASLRLAEIATVGTGIRVERSSFTGDIEIRGVRAGLPPSGVAKDS